jgi:23S rRNA pseudouridine2604 synthase
MRINNYISASGYCSRREADALILAKRVKINGRYADLGSKVAEKDRVEVDGKRIETKSKHVYIALYKPVGITCTTERHVKGNIVDFVGHKERIFPIGRLDKDSEGLILLTSDGSVVNEILRVENSHDKEYQVVVDKKITPDFLEKMAAGVKIFNPVKERHEVTLPCKVQGTSDRAFTIVLSQGLNRQIRRMVEALGYNVVSLKRTRIMHIKLGKLKPGQWRDLSPAEVGGLTKTK